MTTTAAKIDALKDFMRGFGRNNQAALQSLGLLDDWQRIAKDELERRATQVVEGLDEDTLRAIAAGEIDFKAVCRDVAAELAPKVA